MATGDNGVAHILIFPYPAQGHMLPLLDLAHHLARRGLSITILVTPKNLPILSPILAANPSIQTLTLPFPSHPSIPAGVEHIRDLGNLGNLPMMAALSALQDPIARWFSTHPNPPVAILSDFFLGWTHRLAARLGVPRIVFFSSGAFAVDILNHLWGNPHTVEPGAEADFPNIPGSPRFPWDHIPTVFRRYRELSRSANIADGDGLDFYKTSMVDNFKSWAAVTNTFDTLEREFLTHMKASMGHPRVYSVGPLNAVDEHAGHNSVDPQNGTVISWLDKCDTASVLYVCFGSQKVITNAQMGALATALERSGVRFLWVAKPPTTHQAANGYGSVPDGFESQILRQGLILRGWAPQRAILNHRAVGGFLSHCGWNSVLEAVVAGPVILGWPMEADQFINAKLLVDYLGVGFRVCEGCDTVPEPDGMARKIAESMCGGSRERERAKELRDEALGAVGAGGSSNRDLDGFVQELSKLRRALRER